MQSADNQYKHETKKRERQLTVLKERAQQLLADRSKSAAHIPSMHISNCLTRSDGRRSKWRTESSSNRLQLALLLVRTSSYRLQLAFS